MTGTFPHTALAPLIVAVGGTLRANSSGAAALQICLAYAAARGARTCLFTGEDLRMPLYEPQSRVLTEPCERMIGALRQADGIILVSPGYHGSISGTLKNALDYTEELKDDEAAYFDGRAVGCIATAAGWQASAATLSALRAIVHALRGWPTPLGVTLNSSDQLFTPAGECLSPAIAATLAAMTQQVLDFACYRRTYVPPDLARQRLEA
jgi:FMN reductase